MARNTMEAWIPEENSSDVVQRVNQLSAVERHARREPMSTATKSVPRSAGVGVATIGKGTSYGEDESVNDEVVLQARKFGQAIRIAEEDLDDTLVNVVSAKQRDWATSYAKFLDNACLGTTAAANGTTVPFNSVYKVADDASNVTPTAGDIDYDNLSAALGDLEEGDYFEANSVVVVAHPSVRQALRNVKDGEDRPIFVQGLAGTPDTLFGHEIAWSLGAKTHATASSSPEGNALVVFANKDYLLLGVRSGPESMMSQEAGFLTDEPILKMRARRGFAVAQADAVSVLEVTTE